MSYMRRAVALARDYYGKRIAFGAPLVAHRYAAGHAG